MAQRVSIRNIRNTFEFAIGSAADLYASVEPFVRRDFESITTNPLHPSQARRVVALAFLAIVASWEEFIEGVFVRYLCGAQSMMRRRPQLKFGPAATLKDAYSIVAGRPSFDPLRHHMNWSVEETLSRASLFFGSNNPFRDALMPRKRALEDAAIIRNRVAHSSQKARSSFRDVAARLRRRKLPRAYSVGDLLLERVPPACVCDYNGEALFEAYLHTLRCAADEIGGLPSHDRIPYES
jgi:hypothetical protein